MKSIQAIMKEAQDRQKAYSDSKSRDVEYEVGEKVMLKVSPMKGNLKFGRIGNQALAILDPMKY